MSIRIILLGAPGSGKGTQAEKLCKLYKIVQISTGNMLRDSQSLQQPSAVIPQWIKPLSEEVRDELIQCGKEAKAAMEAGELVSDKLILRLVSIRIAQQDCENGFILDGFPRNIDQAKALVDAGINIDHVVEIEVDDEEIVHRLSGRRVHPGSNRVYHIDYNPPKVPDIDDITGEPLIQRNDDSVETIRNRLKIYHDNTKPLIEFYKEMSKTHADNAPRYDHVQGIGSIDEIFKRITDKLDESKSTTAA